MEIEDLAADEARSRIVAMTIDPAVGLQDFQARELAFALGLKARPDRADGRRILRPATAPSRDLDATMVEINPLVVTEDERSHGARRQDDLRRQRAVPPPADRRAARQAARKTRAKRTAGDRGLAYVGLTGDIGCIINGAGLAMATMDMIKLAGGEPANFLDIGGGATPERVAEAFSSVLADRNVEAILVNIFAGINRCDWVAEGVVQALEEPGLTCRSIVRLAGTNVEEGREILATLGPAADPRRHAGRGRRTAVAACAEQRNAAA